MSAAVVKKNNKKISKLQQQAHATHFYILHIVTNFHSVFACLFLHSQSQAERQVYSYICVHTYLVHVYIIYMYICLMRFCAGCVFGRLHFENFTVCMYIVALSTYTHMYIRSSFVKSNCRNDSL